MAESGSSNADSSVQATCEHCGSPLVVGTTNLTQDRECPMCLDLRLRTIDYAFLDNFERFGARSRQVVAEVCLRALVLSDSADRRILGATVYEQFVQAAADLINLYYALGGRETRSIAHSFLSFNLDQVHCLSFFADVVELSPTDILDTLGLIHPDRVNDVAPHLLKREKAELFRILRDCERDIGRLADYQEIGESALVRASDQMRSVFALSDELPWGEHGMLAADKVATLALDVRRGRISLDALSIEEHHLAEVVDAIDVMTRLSRNIIYAFLSLNAPETPQQQPRL